MILDAIEAMAQLHPANRKAAQRSASIWQQMEMAPPGQQLKS
jgi:hypothetical protein